MVGINLPELQAPHLAWKDDVSSWEHDAGCPDAPSAKDMDFVVPETPTSPTSLTIVTGPGKHPFERHPGLTKETVRSTQQWNFTPEVPEVF